MVPVCGQEAIVSDMSVSRSVGDGKRHPLLTMDNAKTPKGEKLGYGTAILYLSPARSGGHGNICPFATKGCIKACLNTAGRAQIFGHIIEARKRKTRMFFKERAAFVDQLQNEIQKHVNWCLWHALNPAIRLNGTSDFPWENYGTYLMSKDYGIPVSFYDYTKNPRRMLRYLAGDLPANYHLIFSRSEDKVNQQQAQAFLALGGRVAIVFEKKPKRYWDYPVVDGDQHDLIFLHPPSTIIGLKPKGKARQDTSGFVIRV